MYFKDYILFKVRPSRVRKACQLICENRMKTNIKTNLSNIIFRKTIIELLAGRFAS